MIPIYLFAGWSGVGKTTFIEGIIPVLKNFGLRVSVIKHDSHDFEIDKRGKDTFRFSEAGAELVIISSGTHAAIMENRYISLGKILDLIHDVDIIIIEGFKNSGKNFRKIGIRRANYELPDGEYIAIISDTPLKSELPVFDINDYNSFCEWLINDIQLLKS